MKEYLLALFKIAQAFPKWTPEEVLEWYDQFIAPALSLGLEFIDYKHRDVGESSGVHIFLYEFPKGFNKHDELNKFMTRDDDNQPRSCYTMFIGEVWHFVPYYA